MSNVMFTGLPTVANATLSDIICAVQGGVSVQETIQQISTLLLENTVLNYAGNPNNNVAGVTFQLLWDTMDEELWVCTTTGTATTAVWMRAGSVTFPIALADGGGSTARQR